MSGTVARLPLHALADHRLSADDLRVLGALYALAGENASSVSASLAELASLTGLDLEQAHLTLRRLHSLGWLPQMHLSSRIRCDLAQTPQGEPDLFGDLLPAAAPSRFEDWWRVYPRKIGKQAARRIWERKGLDRLADDLIAKLRRQRDEDRQWQDLRYVPHPSTYLNQERWEDEIQPIQQPSPRLDETLPNLADLASGRPRGRG